MKRNKRLKLGLIVGLLSTLLVFIGGCALSPEGKGEFNPTIIILLVLIFGVFYFLMVKSQRKRQKGQQEPVQELRKGDKVITVGGIYGEIESLSQDSIVLKIESGATIRIARASIVGIRREK